MGLRKCEENCVYIHAVPKIGESLHFFILLFRTLHAMSTGKHPLRSSTSAENTTTDSLVKFPYNGSVLVDEAPKLPINVNETEGLFGPGADSPVFPALSDSSMNIFHKFNN